MIDYQFKRNEILEWWEKPSGNERSALPKAGSCGPTPPALIADFGLVRLIGRGAACSLAHRSRPALLERWYTLSVIKSHSPRLRKSRWTVLTCTYVAVVCLGFSMAQAEDLIPIATIIKGHADFQLHVVTLRGSITDLEALPPYMTRRGLVVGACRFTLKDDTGSIEVEVDRDCTESVDITRRQNYTVGGILQVRGSKISLIAMEIRRGDE